MDTQAAITVSEGLQSFLPTIKFHTLERPADVMQQVIDSDPKISFYLHSYSISGKQGDYELKVEYVRRNTDKSDIPVAFFQSECEDLMCRYVGKYKKVDCHCKGTSKS